MTVSPAAVTAVPGDTVRLRLTNERGQPIRPAVLGSSTAAATIDATGLVTAVAPGTGVVTATVGTGAQAVTASVPVTVLGLTLDPSRTSVTAGGTVTLRPAFAGDAAAYGMLTWTSSDTTVATVAPDGTVRGVRAGVARIAAVAGVDTRVRAESEVSVLQICCFGPMVVVQPTALTLQTGASQQLAVTVTIPPGAPAGTPTGARFSSSDTSVATVSATGLVTARRNGTAVIRVTAEAAPTIWQEVPVTVRDPGLARLTIRSVTTGDPPVPVDLTAVRGAIRVAVNVPDDFGARRAELWLAGRRAVVRDSIPRGGAAGFTTLTLDVDTPERDPQTGTRLYANGDTTLEVRLEYTQGDGAPQSASVSVRVTLANP